MSNKDRRDPDLTNEEMEELYYLLILSKMNQNAKKLALPIKPKK